MAGNDPTPTPDPRKILVRFGRVSGRDDRFRVRCHEIEFSPDQTDFREAELSDAEGELRTITEAVDYYLGRDSVVLLEFDGEPDCDVRFGPVHCTCGRCADDTYAATYHTSFGDRGVVSSPLGVLKKADLPRRVPEVVEGLLKAARVRDALRGVYDRLRRGPKGGPAPFGPINPVHPHHN